MKGEGLSVKGEGLSVKRGGIVGEREVLQNTPFKFKRSVLNYSKKRKREGLSGE